MSSLSSRARIGYALGSITTATYSTVPGLVLMPYLTDQLGVAAGLAGLVVFAPKAWDFILNPIAGRISDRSQNPRGRRRPFVLRAGLLLALVFVVLFLGPTGPPLAAGLWLLIASLICATVYPFFQVPFIAMSAEITDDYSERTRLLTWRVVVFSFAILVAGGTAPMIVEMGNGVSGYRVMAVVMGALIVAGTAGIWFGTRNVTLTRDEQAGGRLSEHMKIVLRNRDAAMLVAANVIQGVAVSMVLSGIVYVAKHVVQVPGASSLAFVCFVGPAVVFSPLWQRIGLRLGKKTGFAMASVVMGVGFMTMMMSRTGDLGALLVPAAILGLGYAGTLIFPLAMLADIAAEDARASGVNRIGMISGLWSGFELLGFALGPALLGLILGFGGYSETIGGGVTQTDAAKWAIVIGVSAVPALLVFGSLLPLSKYRLDARLQLEAKRQSQAQHTTNAAAREDAVVVDTELLTTTNVMNADVIKDGELIGEASAAAQLASAQAPTHEGTTTDPTTTGSLSLPA